MDEHIRQVITRNKQAIEENDWDSFWNNVATDRSGSIAGYTADLMVITHVLADADILPFYSVKGIDTSNIVDAVEAFTSWWRYMDVFLFSSCAKYLFQQDENRFDDAAYLFWQLSAHCKGMHGYISSVCIEDTGEVVDMIFTVKRVEDVLQTAYTRVAKRFGITYVEAEKKYGFSDHIYTK